MNELTFSDKPADPKEYLPPPPESWVVALGSPWEGEGISLHGPFATNEEALAWADRFGQGYDWHAVLLVAPEIGI